MNAILVAIGRESSLAVLGLSSSTLPTLWQHDPMVARQKRHHGEEVALDRLADRDDDDSVHLAVHAHYRLQRVHFQEEVDCNAEMEAILPPLTRPWMEMWSP